MIEVTDLSGFMVLTLINTGNGEATSETYALKAVSEDGDGRQRLVGTSEDGDDTVVSVQLLAHENTVVAQYRKLIQNLIAADCTCPGPGCRVTFLGHLLESCPPELVDLVKELDPEYRPGKAEES